MGSSTIQAAAIIIAIRLGIGGAGLEISAHLIGRSVWVYVDRVAVVAYRRVGKVTQVVVDCGLELVKIPHRCVYQPYTPSAVRG